MLRCLLLNYPWDHQHPLFSYVQRTGYLTIAQAGALTDALLADLQSEDYDLVFLHLSRVGEVLPESFQQILSQHNRLIVTSPFPRQLHASFGLTPLAYFTEPYTFDRFTKSIQSLLKQNMDH